MLYGFVGAQFYRHNLYFLVKIENYWSSTFLILPHSYLGSWQTTNMEKKLLGALGDELLFEQREIVRCLIAYWYRSLRTLSTVHNLLCVIGLRPNWHFR